MCVHQVMYEVCLGDAWQGMDKHNWVKVCKTHTHTHPMIKT